MMPTNDFIKRSDALFELYRYASAKDPALMIAHRVDLCERIEKVPAANVYTAHEVAEILAELYADDCACNFDGNDEWLPEYCEFSQTVCPYPAGVACWEQWLKWRKNRLKEAANDLD